MALSESGAPRTGLSFFVYSKSEYTLKSVSMSGRPAVYTITPEIIASQPSNFVHSIVTSMSRSSSKMSRIRSEFSDFRLATSWFSIDFSMKNEVPQIFSKNIAFNAVFHTDSESELSLARISFQT